MKIFCAIVLCVVAAEGVSVFDVVQKEWTLFKIQHNKNYSDVEDSYRMKVFLKNRKKIANHNALFEKGLTTFKMEMNRFGDLLHDEVVSMMTGLINPLTQTENNNSSSKPSYYIEPANVELPDTMDWRKLGAVTRVKDQGQCGSCWAFSATGSLEGQHFRKTGDLVSLSEQNLVDCSKNGNDGCHSGLMNKAFEYVKHNGGIDSEETYPYKYRDGPCRYRPPPAATCTSYVILNKNDENKLLSAVATVGPVSVAIDASRDGFRFYQRGVYNDPQCSRTKLTHAVLVVGYGNENGMDYWLVKNSWSEDWGDRGYIKMARNRKNNCGIASFAIFPLV